MQWVRGLLRLLYVHVLRCSGSGGLLRLLYVCVLRCSGWGGGGVTTSPVCTRAEM